MKTCQVFLNVAETINFDVWEMAMSIMFCDMSSPQFEEHIVFDIWNARRVAHVWMKM